MSLRKTLQLLAILTLITTLIACGGATAPTATIPIPASTPTAAAVPPPAAVAAATAAASAPASPSAPTAAPTSAAPSAAAPSVAATTTSPTTAASAAPAASRAATPSLAPSAAPSAAAAAGPTRYTIVADKSTAGYKVGEIFINQGNSFNLAEGKTGDIIGDITIDKTKPSASKIGTIKVDISKLESDSGRRDDMIRDNWLESSKYPIATFVPKRLEGLPDTAYTEGQELAFKIIGDLTIRTVTKEVSFDTKAKIVGDTLTGTAVLKFNMTDFGFDPPSILFVLKAENAVELTLQIEAKKAP